MVLQVILYWVMTMSEHTVLEIRKTLVSARTTRGMVRKDVMTKEEILAMEAGQKLDSLIAKEIFELPLYEDGAIVSTYYFKNTRGKLERPESPQWYSTDISAAWQVVEKMDIAFWLGCHNRIWMAHFGAVSLSAECKSAPEAISKAALLAKLKGGDV